MGLGWVVRVTLFDCVPGITAEANSVQSESSACRSVHRSRLAIYSISYRGCWYLLHVKRRTHAAPHLHTSTSSAGCPFMRALVFVIFVALASVIAEPDPCLDHHYAVENCARPSLVHPPTAKTHSCLH
eukprot:scaffold1343_cov130-Isochrysis_galbana.AAC.2